MSSVLIVQSRSHCKVGILHCVVAAAGSHLVSADDGNVAASLHQALQQGRAAVLQHVCDHMHHLLHRCLGHTLVRL